MKGIAYLAIAGILLGCGPHGWAEEKNGLQVNVTKRTLERSDRREYAYYTRYDRTQGYKVTIKGTAPRPFPEGELSWTILVRKASSEMIEKYVGTEKLKSLRPSESVELMIGAVPIGGYRYQRDYKDEMEYDISIVHAGKETMRLTSTSAFAAMAKRATLVRTPTEDEPGQPGAVRPGVTVTPTPTPPGTTVTPATPGTAKPTAPGTASIPPAPGVAPTPATPNSNPPAPVPATPADGTAKPFDFFNLGNKKPPGS